MSAEAVSAWWPAAPARLTLERDEVHVWRASLEVGPSRLAALLETLSPEERARGRRLRRGRERFIASRGILRAIIARYLGTDGAALSFSYTATYEKPALSGEFAGALRFNLSHSGELGLYALSRNREVGIDAERIQQGLDIDPIVARFFSPGERKALEALPAGERIGAFFDCWTRKEAYVKATGKGLFIPLDEVEVSLAPGQASALVAGRSHAGEGRRWSLEALDVGPGYAAAVAVEGDGFELKRWQWS